MKSVKFNRTKNTKRNLFSGMIQKIVGLLLPFFLRTAIIYTIGIEYLGINTLFASFLNVLSLAELGFGTAIIYSMYEPIAHDDQKMICTLLNYYKKIYHIIGLVILILGLLFTPLVPKLAKGEFPSDINIYIVYLINLISVSLSYFLYAYKASILSAHQRNDVSSWISTITTTLQYLLQIVLLIIFKNYYLFLIIAPIMTIINNILVAVASKKLYPNYVPKGILDIEAKERIRKKIKSLFLYKVGGVVSNSADNIVISAFLGLSVLAIYGNYYYVINALFGILSIYYTSLTAGIGNKIALDTKENVIGLFNEMFFLQGWMIGWMSICLLCLYQDFIFLWLKNPNLLLDLKMVILFVIYFYSWKINDIVYTFKDAAGIWEYDKWRPLLSSFVNLTVNIILVQRVGLYGVVISTIVCEVLFSLLWGTRTIFKYYFNINFVYYLKKILVYTLITIFVGSATFAICNLLVFDNLYITFIFKILICIIFPNFLYIFIYNKNPLFKRLIRRLKPVK